MMNFEYSSVPLELIKNIEIIIWTSIKSQSEVLISPFALLSRILLQKMEPSASIHY